MRLGWFGALLLAGAAQAQEAELPPMVVTGAAERPVAAASEIEVPREALAARPIARTAEALEAAPGLIVTQHSGEGKANQYFLRGFNLDHGTDLAITRRWHAGQHADARAWPGLCRPEFPHPRAAGRHAGAERSVLRR